MGVWGGGVKCERCLPSCSSDSGDRGWVWTGQPDESARGTTSEVKSIIQLDLSSLNVRQVINQ